MPRFDKIAATSEASGFQYYDVETFSFTKPGGVFLPLFSGTTASTTSSFRVPKNRLGKALTSQIMYNILVHIDKNGDNLSFGAGEYRLLSSIGDTVEIGMSGGFPVFYQYGLVVSSDANDIIFTLTVSNGSAVNNVTTQDITFNGTVFLYLAPF
jgi:hypothetical protein